MLKNKLLLEVLSVSFHHVKWWW